jgi:nuclear pore complex protein Nup214
MDLAPLCALTWAAGAAAPAAAAAVTLSEFFAISDVAPSAAAGAGPWLLTAGPAWGAVAAAHRRASDQHVRVALRTAAGGAAAAEFGDDRLAIRIPNAPEQEGEGDTENFVVGLGLDLSATGVNVEHPTDETAPDLAPQPLLWLATSDGALRAYTLGHMAKESPVAEAQPLPPLPRELTEAPAAAAAPAAAGAAPAPAAVAVADEEDKAAGTALPDSDGSDFEEEEVEVVQPAPKAAFAWPPAVAAPSPGFGAPAATPPAAATASAPFSFGGAAPAAQGFALAPRAAEPSLPPLAAAAKPQPQPQPAPAPSPPPAAALPRPPAPAAAAPPPKKVTAAPAPAARLQGAPKEVADLEADFLKSLLATRRLEAALHDAVVAALEGPEGEPGSRAAFEAVRQQTRAAQERAAAVGAQVAAQRGRFEGLRAGVGEAYRKTAAMPAFAPAAAADGADAGGGSPARAAAELRRAQPLDPVLGALRDSLRAQLSALRQKLEEVDDALAAVQERQRAARAGAGAAAASPQAASPAAAAAASVLSLYGAINAQGAVIQAQAARLEALAAAVQGAGLGRSPSLDFDALLGERQRACAWAGGGGESGRSIFFC